MDENNNLRPEYDAAHVKIGGNWRMPTQAEQKELVDNCTSTWTSDYNGTGVSGRIFTSKKAGFTENSIFLPAAGAGSGNYMGGAGSYGNYWSDTFYRDDDAWSLFFLSDDVYTGTDYRNGGLSIRPVTE